jgi:hypothetical protein
MPLFRRNNDDDRSKLINEIVEAIGKANNMSGTPMSSAAPYASTGTGTGGQGLIQTPGFQATPLPRLADAFGSQLGPSAPFLPAPLDPVFDDSGRALPRVWEYPVAWNLNLTNERQNVPWGILRALTDQCDIVHRCIEICVAAIVKMDWSFQLDDYAIQEIMANQNVSHAQAAKIGRDEYKEEVSRLRKFWENPYPDLGRSWSEWLTEFLWQHYAFDGVPVYARYNLGKEIIGFEIIDAPTIKVLLDNRGALPAPPNPSYQQILWGFPRGEYQAAPEADGEFFSGPGKHDEYLRDQLSYFVRNRRTWSPYGFSAVEESVPAATWYMNRQTWLNSEYSAGTMPMSFMTTDAEEMDTLKLQDFERLFNDMLTGSTAERHRIKVLPKGFHPIAMPTVDERYKSDYDEFIIKRIGSIFGVSPSQLGVVPRSGLGGGGEHEGEMEQAETLTLKPMVRFITDTINTLSRRYLGADKNVTFTLQDESLAKNEETQAKANQIYLDSGQKTFNDIRGELGLPLYDMAEADEPAIITAQGPVYLRGTLVVDGAGNTIEQKDDTNDSETVVGNEVGQQALVDQKEKQGPQGKESQGAQSDSTQGNEPQESVGQSKAAKAELTAFYKFVKGRRSKGTWRDFAFETMDEETASWLNAEARSSVLELKKADEPDPFYYGL